MVTGNDVQAALFAFMQRAFGGEASSPNPNERMAEALALMLEHRTLRADTVAAWPDETRGAARAWLTRLLMLVSLFNDLPFPADFLAGTTETRLGEPVISYIHRYRNQLESLGQGNL